MTISLTISLKIFSLPLVTRLRDSMTRPSVPALFAESSFGQSNRLLQVERPLVNGSPRDDSP